MKASRLLLLLPIAASMMVTACGKPTRKVVDAGTIREIVDIEFWNTFSYSAEIENIIAKFHEIEPNIYVKNVKKNGSYKQLKDMTLKGFPANNYPDLVVAYPDHVAEYLNLGYATDVTPYVDNEEYGLTEEDKEDIVPAFLDEGTHYIKPGIYSMPLAKSTEAMYYNEDIIGKIIPGVNIKNGEPAAIDETYLNNLTWEELFDNFCPKFLEWNEKLPKNEKLYLTDQEYHGVVGIDSDDNLFITLAEQYGYGYTNLKTEADGSRTPELLWDNPGMKGLMKTFNKAFHNDYIITQGTADKKHPNDFFTLKNCLFSIGSTGGVKYQQSDIFNVGVARFPQAKEREGGKPAPVKIINQGPSVAFLDHKSDVRNLATWLFYNFMINPDNARYWAIQTGYMPIRQSTFEHDEYIDYTKSEGKENFSLERLTALNAKYVGTVSDKLFSSAVFHGSSTAREQVKNLFINCMNEKKLSDLFLDASFADSIKETRIKMEAAN